MAYFRIWERNKFKVAENREFKEIDRINTVYSSMKSHLLWANPFNEEVIILFYNLDFTTFKNSLTKNESEY